MVCKYCKERKKNWQGSDAICGFNDMGDFVKQNWNCALMNRFRDIAEENEFIIYNKNTENRIAPLPHEDGFIVICWYKDRGTTDLIFNVNSGNGVEYVALEKAYIILEQLENELK